MSTTTPAAAAAAKDYGQQLSIDDLLADDVDAFLDIIAAVRPGAEFTVNDVRARLDEVGVPDKARGGLFAKAAKAGLIRPAVIDVDGHRYPKTVPSTGGSAHAARVRVYVRIGAPP
ncbi:hypothetical protein GXB85_04570 [Cellulomonas sp. APG4]|uniref:hypothetical protein n=1 Tax=Cellulomonas sp. APG4 TaxID=1538656 RepID=UPI00137A6E37|nr:hypothetical protein [Cellulomonas sp. APG4]NCT90228.1 hypothetical protein [Cellulomonas sp. APG4]